MRNIEYCEATADRLCEIQNPDAGWGIYTGEDNSHLPITGEVAVALRQARVSSDHGQRALGQAKIYFTNRLRMLRADVQSLKSTVHLCWLVLGAIAVDIPTSDPM